MEHTWLAPLLGVVLSVGANMALLIGWARRQGRQEADYVTWASLKSYCAEMSGLRSSIAEAQRCELRGRLDELDKRFERIEDKLDRLLMR